MKKIILSVSIILVLMITGCQSNKQKAMEVLKENLERDCSVYTSLDYNNFGGGEFESHGVVEVGICDGRIITASATSVDNSLFSKDYEYQKRVFSFPTDTKLNDMFGDNLFYFYEGYDEEDGSTIISLDLVVNENDLSLLLTTIEEEFISFIREEENVSYVSIGIYTTTYTDVKRDDVTVGYLVLSDQKFYEIRSQYSYMNRLEEITGMINPETETIENLITDFNKSLTDFKIDNNLL